MAPGKWVFALPAWLLAAAACPAGDVKTVDPASALSSLGSSSTDALAGTLRGFLARSLPAPLYENNSHWGKQKAVEHAKWVVRGIDVHPEKRVEIKNDGRWWKVRVTANNLADTLVFDLRELQLEEPGRLLFTAFVSLDTDVEYERQIWKEGVRLYSSSVRARLRVKLRLQCEAVSRLENKGGALPDVVVRLRVLKSDANYDNLVVEHAAGVGGEAAKLLGDAARGAMKQWHPSFERHLLDKANEAIVKSGDTKEVRVSLGKLFGGKK